MKFIRSKLTAALVLGALACGAFSFSTTPVSAQSTVSAVTPSPLLLFQQPELPASALQEANAQAAAAAAQAALDFAKAVAAGIIGSLLANAIGSSAVSDSSTYPPDALDP